MSTKKWKHNSFLLFSDFADGGEEMKAEEVIENLSGLSI